MKAQHASDKNGVVAGLVNSSTRAFEHGERVAQSRRAKLCLHEFHTVETMLALLRQPRRDAFMLRAEHADRVAIRLGEDLIAVRFAVEAPQDQRGIERN
jgi:hypothetical protein